MVSRSLIAVSLLSFALLALGLPTTAAADTVNLDEFAVVRNGTQIFDDAFERNTTLTGGAGTSVSSQTTFLDTGTGASYFVRGSFSETTASNGQANLNTANGIVVSLPDPFIPLTQVVSAVLQTGIQTSPPGPHVLTPSTTFRVTGLFDLSVPTTVLGTYDILLTNNEPGSPERALEFRVRELSTGPILQLAFLDFANNVFTVVSQVPITPLQLANPQLELVLSHDNTSSDVITASVAFGSGNTLATFNGIPTPFGSTNASTDVFTAARPFVQSGFSIFTPVAVPAPVSLALLAAGLLGLGVVGAFRR
jgi:hypothetical protein